MTNPFPVPTSWPPDYVSVFAWRQRQIMAMRAQPSLIKGADEYYRTHPVEWIEHWVSTYDPRNAGRPDKLTTMPFVLFPRQREFVIFLWQCLIMENDGLVEKCRDMGATWVSCAFSVWLWKYWPGAAIGWGSRKQELVDELGVVDSIMEKMRVIIRNLPQEFWPKGFSPDDHMPFMRIINPETGATITGEVGDNIGRGGRKLLVFKDESAHYARPEKIEAALGDTTRVQIDISSVNGPNNVFHKRRKSGVDWNPMVPFNKGKTAVFIMDWRQHPEKDYAWYEARRKDWEDRGLLHVFSQEVDRNYAASVAGTIIKPHWIAAAIDADKKLGFEPTGPFVGSLDVADDTVEGDTNAQTIRRGPCLLFLEGWGGVDTGVTARKAVNNCRLFGGGAFDLNYDVIGVGAGVKAETNRLRTEGLLPDGLRLVPWNAAGKVLFPKQRLIPLDKQSPLNEDYFQNFKAQGWWQLARRFERTFRAVTEGREYDPGELISIPSTLPNRARLEEELAQPVFTTSTATGKTMVDKTPSGTPSPNDADSVMMAYWPANSGAPRWTKGSLG